MRDEPTNLSPAAQRSLSNLIRFIVRRDQATGTARKVEARILARCYAIQTGAIVGRKDDRIVRETPLRYSEVSGYVIGFRPQSREVVQIYWATRQLDRLFAKVP